MGQKMKRAFIFWILHVILLTTMVNIGTAHNFYYVEYTTANMEQLEMEINSLKSQGIRVVHIIPPNVLLTKDLVKCDYTKIENPQLNLIISPENDNNIDESRVINKEAYNIWRYLVCAQMDEPIIKDFENNSGEKDNISQKLENLVISDNYNSPKYPFPYADEMFTSNFMIGRIAVNIILLESIGDDENWTVEEEDTTIAEIFDATSYWSDKAEALDINVSWVYDIHRRVPTIYEPIQGKMVPYWDLQSLGWRFMWINNALSYLGYSKDEWSGCFEMANDMRKRFFANWSFSMFVVMDKNDEDHKFTDGKTAFVPRLEWFSLFGEDGPMNGCFSVSTYNNGETGAFHMNNVLQHEIAHLFRAQDEYRDNCDDDDCSGNHYGYLQVVNGNCEKCNNDHEYCVMYNKNYFNYICDYTKWQIGWRDSDGDGPADPLDHNIGGWMSILNVEPGDLIKIFTVSGTFCNVISVTSDNLLCQDSIYHVIWDGHNYDNKRQPAYTVYLVSVNNGSPFTCYLNPGEPTVDIPYFSDIVYSNSKLTWKLNQSFAYVRCYIYDESNNLISRLIWDKAYACRQCDTNSLDIIPSGHTYTAKFYAWRPDGAGSQTVEYQFYHGCQGECGDANGNGSVNVSDAQYMVNYVFSGGPVPQPVFACGNPNNDTKVNVSDAVYLINFVFSGGNPPGNCNPDAFPDAPCCPYEE